MSPPADPRRVPPARQSHGVRSTHRDGDSHRESARLGMLEAHLVEARRTRRELEARVRELEAQVKWLRDLLRRAEASRQR